jgi:hypothetical protein
MDWSHGFWWSWAKIGVPSGLMFGLLGYAWQGGPIGRAVGAAIFFGVFFGFTMTILMRWRVRGFLKLDRPERVTVATAVEGGRHVEDRALAAAVIESAAAIRKGGGSEELDRAIIVVFPVLGLVLGIGNALSGDGRAAVVFLCLSLWFAIQAFRLPARRRRLLSNAAVAETAARQLIDVHKVDVLRIQSTDPVADRQLPNPEPNASAHRNPAGPVRTNLRRK